MFRSNSSNIGIKLKTIFVIPFETVEFTLFNRAIHYIISKWNILTIEEKQLALKIVESYVDSTPDKTFRKDPTTYLNNKSFNDEIIIRSATTSYKPNVSERNFTQLASLKYIEPK